MQEVSVHVTGSSICPISFTKKPECDLRTECDPRARGHSVGGRGASVLFFGRQKSELSREAGRDPGTCFFIGV